MASERVAVRSPVRTLLSTHEGAGDDMRFTDFLTENCILPALKAQDKPAALRELAGLLAVGTKARPERLETLLIARERVASTAIGQGVAVPHCKLEGLPRTVACVGIHPKGLGFDTPGAEPVHIFFGLVSPPNLAGMHVGVLSRIVALMRDARLREALRRAPSAAAIRALLVEAESSYTLTRAHVVPARVTPLPR
jgi:PTS system nitrogen regulatory IIA component